MKGDFSQVTFRPERLYSSVRMQQGRVPVDADWNEQVDIDANLRRAAVRDIIGGCCIPASEPDSFRVTFSGTEVSVAPGRMWVSGNLAETTAAQTLPLPASGRHLVYLEVFERHVTAIEDPDIREVALGGPDTGTRTATTARARIMPVEETATCTTLAGFTPPGETTGQLTASTGTQPPDTPCVVPAAAGYSRLENQLYRIEIHNGGTIGGAQPPTFKWSRDNGSIAAEWLELDGNELVIPDAGRDGVLGFQENQWVELSHDALDLDGLPGILVEVVGRRTDADGRFHLQFDAHAQTVLDPTTLGHPKVRRWDQQTTDFQGISIAAADTDIAIEGGIVVRFSQGTYRSGDFWLIPARTFSNALIGDILWPRDSAGNRLPKSPDGVPRFYCRLAVIDGATEGGTLVDDCRRVFPSLCGLTRSSGCCTVTVGSPGGDLATIADGLQRLPTEGGELCILPGVYNEHVVLNGRSNIHIHGCGERARIVSTGTDPVFNLTNMNNITIRSLSIEAPRAVGVNIRAGTSIELRDLRITSRDRSAVAGIDLKGFALTDSRIDLLSLEVTSEFLSNLAPAVFVAGDDLLVEGNRIRSAAISHSAIAPAGGVQVGGGSRSVEIRRNMIADGSGRGIILGSISQPSQDPGLERFFDDVVANPRSREETAASGRLNAAAAHFSNLRRESTATILAPKAAGEFEVQLPGRAKFISDGDLTDVQILENHIRDMGSSGITVAQFFNLNEGESEFISVAGLEIIGNRIERCLHLRHVTFSNTAAEDAAIGGISLADVTDLVVRDNEIERNGITLTGGVCGVFVLHGRGIEIHRNRIRHNGPAPQAGTPPTAERRGGVVVGFAETPTRDVRLFSTTTGGTARPPDTTRLRQDGTPAARIHDNVVIAPAGRALEMVALGPVSIQGNQFTALGAEFRGRSPNSIVGLEIAPGASSATFVDALGGAVILVLNLGISNEFYLQIAGFAGLKLVRSLGLPEGDTSERRPVLAGGNIQFEDNQVILDALDSVTTLALSSITLFTLDDLSMSANQSDCDLMLDFAVTNLIAGATSLRVTDNRFKEGLLNAFLSALTIGLLNTTTNNQGTHCFITVTPVRPPSHENTVMVTRLPGQAEACSRFAQLEESLQAAIFGG
jgi:hypothetical protein